MKKLIAAAVAAAVIAPASVMAAGPTLYGKIHLSVDSHDNNGSSSAGTQYDEWSLQSNSSRVGVKGSEDLGNGMKVGYLIEWGVTMDGNASNMTSRNRAVTLSGDWGTALAGKWDTPYKTAGRKVEIFADQIGDMRNISGEYDAGSIGRADNAVAYVTPNMNGFSATVAYVFDLGEGNLKTGTEYSDDNSDNSAWSFNAIYNNGPMLVALGYVSANDDGQVARADLDDTSSWRLGGAYKFGDFKVVASYTDFESLGWTKDNDPSIWSLGATYSMGNNVFKINYADRDDSGLDTCNGSGTGAGTGTLKCKDGSDMITVGLDHKMSKRTTVYATYSTMDNDKNANRTVWGGGHGSNGTARSNGVYNEDADAFSVGIIHKF